MRRACLLLLCLSGCLPPPVIHSVRIQQAGVGAHFRSVHIGLSATNDNPPPFVVFVRSARVSVAPSLILEPFTVVIPGTDGRELGPVTILVPLRFRSHGPIEDLQLLDSVERALTKGTLELHVIGRAWLGAHVLDVDVHLPISRSELHPKD